MKRVLLALVFIACASMLTASLSGTLSIANAQVNSMSSDVPGVLAFNDSIPQPPLVPSNSTVGAYEQINYGPWIKVNVTETSGPFNASTPMEGNTYGVEGANMENFGGITDADLKVSFSTFSGEHDSNILRGDNSWSIQLNSNFFDGNNGQTDWVQFVYQNKLFGLLGDYSQFGIWNVDVTTQTYHSVTVSVGANSLSTSETYEIYATDYNGELTTILTLDYSNGDVYNYYEYAADQYGLSAHWSEVSGTVLGAGGGSTAEFTSPTAETTTVSAYPSSTPYAGLDVVTGEQNNLNLGSVTTSGMGGWYFVTSQSSN
jgi:hypothetical protein